MRKTLLILLTAVVVVGGIAMAAHQIDLGALIRQLHGR